MDPGHEDTGTGQLHAAQTKRLTELTRTPEAALLNSNNLREARTTRIADDNRRTYTEHAALVNRAAAFVASWTHAQLVEQSVDSNHGETVDVVRGNAGGLSARPISS